ncbi:AAA family ATPase [Baaleninema simplex]|uniref:AAA family ATPase n=1 Tax=Baaleninema simplex TaxID=2862350 RepID=UPI00034607FF|nr:AAA family ATPase [Baaleninema simplex]
MKTAPCPLVSPSPLFPLSPAPMFPSPDIATVYRACNPSQTLNVNHPDERAYYINLAAARGGDITGELDANITLFSPNEPTCQLLAGHIGCGKSTELRRLQASLQDRGFYVIYFESSQDLDMADLDVGDILLAIARQVSENLVEVSDACTSGTLVAMLEKADRLLTTEIPAVETDGASGSLRSQLRRLSQKTHGRPDLRGQLRQYLEPRIQTFLDALNRELLEPAIAVLRQQGKQGLVIAIDNLDRIEMTQKPWGRSQPEYLFVDRGDRLSKLSCHVVYTIPLSLLFSRELSRLTLAFGIDPKVLPMVSVKRRDGRRFAPGLSLLRQMVLARAFPQQSPQERLTLVPKLFDRPQTLDLLCYASGGHVRNLLRLLHHQIEKERAFPLSRESLDAAMRERRDRLFLSITPEERTLLKRVAREKRIDNNDAYRTLVRSMFVFEYRDDDGSWFDINPLLQ